MASALVLIILKIAATVCISSICLDATGWMLNCGRAMGWKFGSKPPFANNAAKVGDELKLSRHPDYIVQSPSNSLASPSRK